MGATDVRDKYSRAPQSPEPPDEDEAEADIARLNQEWRQKRDSFKMRTGGAAQAQVPPPQALVSVPPLVAAAEAAAARRAAAADGRQFEPGPPGPLRPGSATGSRPASRAGGNDQGLAAAAAGGALEECQRLLASGAEPCSWGPDGTSPLCAAAMWGHPEVVRLLLDAQADPCQANRSGLRPTALHSAALQEHGKVCMMLLSARADPREADGNGVSATDFAACSEAVWPHFAAIGCARASKPELIAKGVIRKVSPALEQELAECAPGSGDGPPEHGLISEFTRPGSAYVVTSHFPPRPGSSMASSSPGPFRPGSRGPGSRSGSRGPSGSGGYGGNAGGSRPGSRSRRPAAAPIDILSDGGGGAAPAPAPERTPVAGRPPRPGAPPTPSSGAEGMRSLGL